MDTLQYKELYRRHLPHFQPGGATLFVTYRLAGSVPATAIDEFQREAEGLRRRLDQIPDSAERAKRYAEEQRRLFARWDGLLDNAIEGPFWLRQPANAALVAESLHKLDGLYYELLAFCIMPNHVHAVFTPLPSGENSYHALSQIMHSPKGYTAHMANRQSRRKGAFWQNESYDHVVRSTGELQRIIAYVQNNPVRAGLVQEWQQWPWTYCKDL
jgi:putative transposase